MRMFITCRLKVSVSTKEGNIISKPVVRLTRNELIAAINYRGGRRGGKELRYISTTLVSIALTRARVVIMQMQYAIYNRSKR